MYLYEGIIPQFVLKLDFLLFSIAVEIIPQLIPISLDKNLQINSNHWECSLCLYQLAQVHRYRKSNPLKPWNHRAKPIKKPLLLLFYGFESSVPRCQNVIKHAAKCNKKSVALTLNCVEGVRRISTVLISWVTSPLYGPIKVFSARELFAQTRLSFCADIIFDIAFFFC